MCRCPQNRDHACAVEEIRIQFLGKKGLITLLFDDLKALSLDEKKQYGPRLNELKTSATSQISDALERLKQEALAQESQKSAHFDVTAYDPALSFGHQHPYTHIVQTIEDIFISYGLCHCRRP